MGESGAERGVPLRFAGCPRAGRASIARDSREGENGTGSVLKRFLRRSSNGLGGGLASDRATLTIVEIGAFRKNVAVLRSSFCDFNVLTG